MTRLPLNMNPADPPPFFHLDELAFQEMCRNILEREEGVRRALINFYLHQGQSDAAKELFDRYRENFSAVGAQSNLTRWYIHLISQKTVRTIHNHHLKGAREQQALDALTDWGRRATFAIGSCSSGIFQIFDFMNEIRPAYEPLGQ